MNNRILVEESPARDGNNIPSLSKQRGMTNLVRFEQLILQLDLLASSSLFFTFFSVFAGLGCPQR